MPSSVEPVNPKDRHIAAAAATHHADIVVSNDRRLRRELANLGQQALSGDEFVAQLAAQHPSELNTVIDLLVAKRTRPPITRAPLCAGTLSHKG